MEFDCMPNGPRLGRIRGDLDRACLELTAMRTEHGQIARPSESDRAVGIALGQVSMQIRNALGNLDVALREVNAARNPND